MARYRIVRIYEVPADNRYQATDRMMEAIVLGTEKDYHVKDVIRLCEKDCTALQRRAAAASWLVDDPDGSALRAQL